MAASCSIGKKATQQRFCDEYLVSFNAYQAALNAGYSNNTARKCELLHLPKIQTYLQAAMAKTAERLEITHDMILRELAKVAFANMGDYYDENAVLKPMNQLTPDQKAAIQQYQLIDAVGDYGERAGELSKIKLHNKMAALDKIARHTGFYAASQSSKSKVQSQQSKLILEGAGKSGS
ncbi:terminase small subunit [Mucilaginibacter sp. HMF5004]|uniref:terminase small subunit n=1 Tax=Mucilaginibacter rivuli TaxID=2857527 RepID=UPI001C5D6208|nr:terminase small subunit [Mucilaginibacter rivuli]MBW4891109.1 terminase small subunit [Mucilaginibacter rivuli]